jgi:hypothetical protein
LNFILKKSPRISSTQSPVDMSAVIFKEPDVESQMITFIDYKVVFGVSSYEEKGDKYPSEKIKACNIRVIATPILFGVLPSIAKMTIKRAG